MAKPAILDYSDYREFLRDSLEWGRAAKPWFSLRSLGQRLELDAGNLLKVTQKERHLPERCLDALAQELELNEREGEYLRRLVEFGKAKGSESVRKAYERLLDLQCARPEVLGKAQYEFYKDWRNTAVLALLHLEGAKTTDEELANLLEPRAGAEDVRRILTLLGRLGLARKGRNGRWVARRSLVTTGEKWKDLSIRAFQRDTIRLAERALERISPEQRDISTLTVAMSGPDLEKVRELAREFRRNVLALAAESNGPDRVWQVNLQVFPLSVPLEARS